MAYLMRSLPTIYKSITETIMDSRFALGRIFIWLVAEICLSSLGIDDLADYSEFIFEKNIPILITQQDKV